MTEGMVTWQLTSKTPPSLEMQAEGMVTVRGMVSVKMVQKTEDKSIPLYDLLPLSVLQV